MNAAPTKPSRLDPVARPFTAEEDRVRLRGRPSELVGIMTMRREPLPKEAFKTATTDIGETEFGYLHRLAFAPLVSTSLPIDTALPRTLSIAGNLSPGASGRVPIRFSVERTTPPGTYEAVFSLGGAEQVAEIEVLPDEVLEIIPRSIAVAGPPGGVAYEQLILRNAGNVPIEIDVLGVLVLQEQEQVCLSLQYALDQTRRSSEEGAHRVFLDALASSLGGRKTDVARVRVADGPCHVPAGDAVEVRIAIHLPKDMIAGRQYRALLKAGTAQLFVKIKAEPGEGKPRSRPQQEAAS